MKIEKVNDNQIRCTLTREDLANRELKISELAYGTEKAKSLFRDMMKQASYEFGFEAEDIPLMIEAIPMSAECIVLIITKVDDPEELDTRFSRFTPSEPGSEDEEEYDSFAAESMDAPDEVMDLFRKLREDHQPGDSMPARKEVQPEAPKDAPAAHVFRMDSMQQVLNAVHLIHPNYSGSSALYKDEKTGSYLLCLSQNDMPASLYNKICNTMTEYGQVCHHLAANQAYLREHYTILLSDRAIHSLGHCS